MDAPDVGRIVVDQTDDTMLTIAFDADFFVQFSLHSSSIPILPGCILDGNVTTDADRTQRMEPLFPLSFASRVLKKAGASGVTAFEDHIGDQLLEGWIGFHQTSRTKGLILPVKNGRKVSVDVWLKSGKRSQLIKQLCRNYQNFFVFGHVQSCFLWD